MSTTFTIPTLETERLSLRAPQLADFETFADFYADDRSSFVGGPLEPDQAWRTLAVEAGHWVLNGFGRFSVVEKSSGDLVGTVGLWFPVGFPEHELGWDLYGAATGKGYATEAGRAVRDFAYGALGWNTLISLVAVGNDASAAVATRLGAHFEGMFTHKRFGEMQVFRHPGPEALA